MSHGFGSTKHPDSCSARNVAARDPCVDFISEHYAALARARFPFGVGAPSAFWLEHSHPGCVAGRPLACRNKHTGRDARLPHRQAACATISRAISRSAAVGRQRRRSDRNRELAELRWCDRILAVRQANLEANPTGAHPGKLPQH
jgi:hypothetical protein